MPLTNAQFTPHKVLRNAHVQTLLPRLVLPKRKWQGAWQLLELSDGDFVELCWHPDTVTQNDAPTLLLFHGLEGSVDSPYIWQTMDAAAKRGWRAVVMHFRGCGREPINRLPRAYHSGDVGDATEVIAQLYHSHPNADLYLAGFSLGGNMLAQLLTTSIVNHQGSRVKAGAICCAPLDLNACSEKIEHGFSTVYRRYLLEPLKKKFSDKRQLGVIDAHHPLATVDVKPMKSFFEFDDKVTAPLHGFRDVNDYYQQASGLPFLNSIQLPTLVIHAQDDPFMGAAVVPTATELAKSVRYELSQWGGHMGFINFVDGAWHSWLPQRLLNFFEELGQQ